MCPIKVLAGSLKGRILKFPENPDITRPIMARVKKSLFDIISMYFTQKNINFLDIFSGTGQIGIEALSRGAEFATFVEKDKTMAECIKSNLLKCKVETKSNVINMDAFDFLEIYSNSKGFFDIIFLGPPYPINISNDLLNLLDKNNILGKDGIIILQHSKHEITLDKTKNFIKFRTKIYGDTVLDFFKQID